jgi:nucleotide-binding universal stress UspA family protein
MSPLAEAISRAVSELDDDRHTDGQELVDRLSGDIRIDTEAMVVDGAPAERLAELARERNADEIVVGSRGMGRFAAALGSVSHALLAHADHPVVVDRARPRTTHAKRRSTATAPSSLATTPRGRPGGR